MTAEMLFQQLATLGRWLDRLAEQIETQPLVREPGEPHPAVILAAAITYTHLTLDRLDEAIGDLHAVDLAEEMAA